MKTIGLPFFFIACAYALSLECRGQELRSSLSPSHTVHWGVGGGLHSSTHPTWWIGEREAWKDEVPENGGRALKEPVVPDENLDIKRGEEGTISDASFGTFYESGIASYYSAKTHGKRMASGELYDKEGLFCAHKTLPFGTKLRVVNKTNGKEVVVEVKDRGPLGKGRVIDLSNKAAAEIDMISAGLVLVELWVVE